MTEIQTGNERNKETNKIFIGVSAVLGLLLVIQTGYLFNLSKRVKQIEQPPQPNYYRATSQAPVSGTRSLPAAAFQHDQWDPFSEIERMQAQMDRMFSQTLRNFSSMGALDPSGTAAFFEPDVDIQDKKDHYLIRMDVPGLEKDQIKIEVTENALTVSGERKSEQTQEDERQGFYRMERSYGSFHRQIPLPHDVKPEGVTANYEKGVLTIKIQKEAAENKPARKSVAVQ